jgi:hypothetical protein
MDKALDSILAPKKEKKKKKSKKKTINRKTG